MPRPSLSPVFARAGHLSRRQFAARALALGPAVALTGWTLPGRAAVAQGLDPASTIQHFYLAVATYAYEEAYAMLSESYQASQSYQAFVDGYSDTAFVTVETGNVAANAGTATVPATITSWKNDGSITAFGGSYTLVSVGSAWIIDSADITEQEPGNVAQLMKSSEISIELGPTEAATGHRYFSLIATNTSDSPVVAAGIPALAIQDAGGNTLVKSKHQQLDSIAAVTLQPGDAAEAQFEWSNWCGADPATPLVVVVTLPGDPSTVDVPFGNADGTAAAPPCMGDAEPTTFTAGAFEQLHQ